MYAHDNGDLYKAAVDIPDEPRYFADFTVLGPNDSDYYYHYNKKTNHKIAPTDYHIIREFIENLNNVPDEDFETWLESSFDVESFLSYLVISNFIANWDSYPQRPKNFWIYEDLNRNLMVYIPWDLDSTFNPYKTEFNQMGTDASIFFNLLESDYEPHLEMEGYERPLTRRIMERQKYQDAYIANYINAMDTILRPSYLAARIDKLTELIYDKLSNNDQQQLQRENNSMKIFFVRRYNHVSNELNGL